MNRVDKNRILVFVAYFGKFPAYFDAWRLSALKNNTIDFCIISDSNKLVDEANVKVLHISFGDYIKKIQSKFEFKIKCDFPYKLCDYRPMYGSLFSDLIQEYDFWGYCDIDLVFGNIRSFLSDDILDNHDRLLVNGHFSLYRNCPQMNELYLSEGKYPEYNASEAYTTNDACYFDEFRGMELKCLRNNIKTYYAPEVIVDIPYTAKTFGSDNREVYYWDEGELYSVLQNGKRKKLLYTHFQKRNMLCDGLLENTLTTNDTKRFVIIPNKIEQCSDVTDEMFNISMWGGYSIRKRFLKAIKALKKYRIKKNIERKRRQKDVEKLRSSTRLLPNPTKDSFKKPDKMKGVQS